MATATRLFILAVFLADALVVTAEALTGLHIADDTAQILFGPNGDCSLKLVTDQGPAHLVSSCAISSPGGISSAPPSPPLAPPPSGPFPLAPPPSDPSPYSKPWAMMHYDCRIPGDPWTLAKVTGVASNGWSCSAYSNIPAYQITSSTDATLPRALQFRFPCSGSYSVVAGLMSTTTTKFTNLVENLANECNGQSACGMPHRNGGVDFGFTMDNAMNLYAHYDNYEYKTKIGYRPRPANDVTLRIEIVDTTVTWKEDGEVVHTEPFDSSLLPLSIMATVLQVADANCNTQIVDLALDLVS